MRLHATLCRTSAILLGVALAAGVCSAHDFWAEPTNHTPRVGEEVAIRLRVGEELKGEEFPASDRHRARFEVLGPVTTQVTPGADKHSNDSETSVEAERFPAYLEEEGNGRWLAHWRSIDPAGTAPVKEAFSRCVKTLLNVGDQATGRCRCARGFDRLAGLRLELVPLSNPLAVRPGGCLALRLLLDGRPVAVQERAPRAGPSGRGCHLPQRLDVPLVRDPRPAGVPSLAFLLPWSLACVASPWVSWPVRCSPGAGRTSRDGPSPSRCVR